MAPPTIAIKEITIAPINCPIKETLEASLNKNGIPAHITPIKPLMACTGPIAHTSSIFNFSSIIL